MKRIIITATLTFLISTTFKNASFAQTQDTLLNEGFETGSFTTGWSQLDADGNTQCWTIESGTSLPYGGYVPHIGTKVAISFSAYVTPDNYLITPKLTINDTSFHLSFWATGGDPMYPSEHYSVLVSETGTNASDFTEIYSETCAGLNEGDYKNRVLSLSAYNGKDIYIAFRHHQCSDQWVLKLDDVQVVGTHLDVDASGISEIKMKDEITVYPNPTAGTIFVSNVKNPLVEVYDNTGKLVLLSNDNEISLGLLNDGFYSVKIKSNNSTIVKKISVIK